MKTHFTDLFKDTYPVLSTGKGKEFRALEGIFDSPFVENLAETLDGVVDAVFFNYQDKAAAETLFYEWFTPNQTFFPSPNKVPVFERLAPLIAAQHFPPLKVVLSTPEDQDFDVENITEGPGWVFDCFIMKVNQGQEEEFKRTLKAFKARMLNIKDVENFYTFDVNRDILADPRASLPEDNERIEMIVVNHVSREARQRAFGETSQTPEFAAWGATFRCLVCPLLRDVTRQDYLPPYRV